MAFDPLTMQADLVFGDGALAAGDDLETAVIMALFSDARARPDDAVRGDPADRRGWWGDALPPTILGRTLSGDRWGSRLWLLEGAPQSAETLARARQYAQEALQVLVDVGLASRIDVAVSFPRQFWLAIGPIVVWRPDGARRQYGPWEANWQAQALLTATAAGSL